MNLKRQKVFSLFKLNKFSFSTLNAEMLRQSCKFNMYNGVEVNLEEIISKENRLLNFDQFPLILDYSINEWEKQNARSIIVRVPSYLSNYISLFLDRGFSFHHTIGNFLILTRWMDRSTKCKIPHFAHHHIGIGACILNEKLDFLLIKEKFTPLRNKNKLWKFVTGLVEEGEGIIDATIREVCEEVNMNAEYHGCIGLSEIYPNFQKISDLCFFNLCSIKGVIDYTKIVIDQDELAEAKFFNLEEVNNLIKEKQLTVLTINTLNKLIPMIDFDKSLEENVEYISQIGLLKRKIVDISNFRMKVEYVNMFI